MSFSSFTLYSETRSADTELVHGTDCVLFYFMNCHSKYDLYITLKEKVDYIIVSTGGWFSVRYVTTATCRAIFRRLRFKRKTAPARFTKFAGYLHWGVSFSGNEISLILKNKMAATGISLKIYFFLLAGSPRWKVESLHQ